MEDSQGDNGSKVSGINFTDCRPLPAVLQGDKLRNRLSIWAT